MLKGDADKAYDRFEAAAKCFDAFDLERAGKVRGQSCIKIYDEGLKYSGPYLTHAIMLGEAAIACAIKAKATNACAAYQNNLGLALQEQGIRSEGEVGSALLNRAIAAYEAVLEARTKGNAPVDWAMTQNNLGNALANQGIRSESEVGNTVLARAVTAYEAALQVHTKDTTPVDWAMTQNNLGNALQEQGIRSAGEAGKNLLSRSVTAYEAALEVHTKDAMPFDWAKTHGNIGLVYTAQAQLSNITEDSKTDLTLALNHLDQALTVFDPEHMSYHYRNCKTTRDWVAAALAALGE